MSLWVAGESWLCLDSWIQISGRHWSDGVDVGCCKYNPGIKKIVLMVISKLLIAGQYSVFLFLQNLQRPLRCSFYIIVFAKLCSAKPQLKKRDYL